MEGAIKLSFMLITSLFPPKTLLFFINIHVYGM